MINSQLLKELDKELDICLEIFGKYSVLPELKKFLGREEFLEFLELFSGVNINVPDDRVLMRWLRDYQIYKRLSNLSNRSVIEELSKKHNLSPERIRHIHMEIREMLKDESD